MSDPGESTTMILLVVCCMSFLCCVLSIGGTYVLAKDAFNKIVNTLMGGGGNTGDTSGDASGGGNTGDTSGYTGTNDTRGGDTSSGNTGGVTTTLAPWTTTLAPGGGCTESSWKQCPDSGCCYQGQCAKTETCFGCASGSENCICKGDGTCNAGLSCVNNKCVKAQTGGGGGSIPNKRLINAALDPQWYMKDLGMDNNGGVEIETAEVPGAITRNSGKQCLAVVGNGNGQNVLEWRDTTESCKKWSFTGPLAQQIGGRTYWRAIFNKDGMPSRDLGGVYLYHLCLDSSSTGTKLKLQPTSYDKPDCYWSQVRE